MPEERLQKLLSQAGVTSRRKAEEMIVEGRVTVNGKTVTELGSKADLETDHIKVDGQLLHSPKHYTYIALNKPKACMTTVSDPEGRQTVMHLMRGIRERVFPVGRLDYHSEGLLLLTSDGEFAHRLMDPANHVTKVYVVKVTGALTEEQEKLFREGIPMHGRKTAPAEIKLIKHGANPWYEVKITEGRQNQIRVMFKHLGKLVEKLRRVKIGFLELDLPPGRYRTLTPPEVAKFRRVLKLDETTESTPVVATPATAVPKPAPMPKPHKAKPKREPRNAGKRYDGPRKFALPKGARPAALSAAPRPAGSQNALPPGRGPKPALRRDGPSHSAIRNTGAKPGSRNAGPRNAGPRKFGARDAGPRKLPRR
jgi:23S rRNA pseudouridine2605 synthase